MKSTLSIDIETFSSVDLIACGLYKYVESDDFQVMLMAYSLNGGDVEIVDLTKNDLPRDINIALRDGSVDKWAYNAAFERICLSRFLGVDLSPGSWYCTMTLGLMAGLPGSLSGIAEVLQLDEQKMSAGKALITYFSKPCTPTKSNNNRIRNLPHHDPDKWELFMTYCRQDVKTEMAVRDAITTRYPELTLFSDFERRQYLLDQKINDTGVRVDTDMVDNLIDYYAQYKSRLHSEAAELSGLDNPNSRSQLIRWLQEQDISTADLKKKTVNSLLADTDNDDVRDLLILRQELAKTSMSKYDMMQRAVCNDGRIHGVLQYYGANRTGRWAGRLVQVQNLPRTNMKEQQLDCIRRLVKLSEFQALEAIYETVSDLFSQLIRTAFIPSPKRRYAVCDYSAIEARVIAYLANEQWRLDVFASHGKIYEASASEMFRVPIDQVDKPLRSKGKIAELALGYGGSTGALIQMGALDMGLSEEELPDLVAKWRRANPSIVKLWKDVELCVKRALQISGPVYLKKINQVTPVDIRFEKNGSNLQITLPSGRSLIYWNARIEGEGSYTRIAYDGMDQKKKKWMRQETFGGKLVENITQAIARDCLAEAMLRLHDQGFTIVFHVHDEIICEVDRTTSELKLEQMRSIMSQPIPWASGLILTAAGYTSDFYLKD